MGSDGGTSNMQQSMEKWFEECLLPKMIECESVILNQYIQSSELSKQENVPPQKQLKNSAYTVKRKKATHCQDNPKTAMIHAEFQKFKLENERHQREIRKEREEQTVYILDTDSPVRMPKPTEIAPTQHPQHIKNSEMKKLYGHTFYSIHLLELKLQAKFDAINDANHPPLWPFIPLKI